MTTKHIEHVRPVCWKCRDMVPVFEAECCYLTDQIYLTAKCHGEIESHVIPGDFFTYNYVQQSYAFHPDNKVKYLDENK